MKYRSNSVNGTSSNSRKFLWKSQKELKQLSQSVLLIKLGHAAIDYQHSATTCKFLAEASIQINQ